MTDSAVEYFHAVVPSTPPALCKHLLALPHETVHAIDALLRFVLDASCPATAPDDVRATWEQSQNEASWRIAQLRKRAASVSAPTGLKRTHDDASPGPSSSTPAGSSKRAKTDSSQEAAAAPSPSPGPAPPDTDADDPPLFSLHALSLSSPIRKKADITIHARTLRLTSGLAHTPESPPIPLAALRRAFLLPTRGKSKPHWTVLLMPTDVPIASGKAGAEARGRERAGELAPLVAFGVDAVPNSPLSTSTYEASTHAPHMTVHQKGTPAEPALRAFFSHLRVPVVEPRTDVFRSATGEDVAGVEAYRGAKAGTLWFLSEGVLWDGRPAEFFALRDLAPADADELEGVRTISATGRTCSIVIRRIEEGAEGDVAEMDFGMVDGKEQEGIARWVRHHRHLFGKRDEQPVAGPSTNVGAGEDVDDDEEDEDFVASDSDDGSASESDAESGEDGAETVDEDEAQDTDGEDKDGDGEDALDPARHPLLRPGAMPKRMSRAAIEMVVGVMEQELAGGRDDGEDELED